MSDRRSARRLSYVRPLVAGFGLERGRACADKPAEPRCALDATGVSLAVGRRGLAHPTGELIGPTKLKTGNRGFDDFGHLGPLSFPFAGGMGRVLQHRGRAACLKVLAQPIAYQS